MAVSDAYLSGVAFTAEKISDDVDKYLPHSPVTFRQFFSGLSSSSHLRSAFIQALRTSRHTNFFFETPPFAPQTLDQPFEFVLVNAPFFNRVRADGSPFEEFIGALQGPEVAVFDNLNGDARLVVPSKAVEVDAQAYAHVAAFVRNAPNVQVHSLFQRVGDIGTQLAAEEDKQRWLSTSGAGVIWLHFRFDTRPKYYTFQPYKHAPASA